MEDSAKQRYLWFKASILLGGLLGLVLLVQSILTYRFVASSMVRLEAKRESDRKLQSLIRGARQAGNRDLATLRPLMDELISEAPQQIAWMRVLDMSGRELAHSGKTAGAPVYAADTLDKIVEDRERLPDVRKTPGGSALVTLNPLFVGLPPVGRAPRRGVVRNMPGV